MSLFGRIALTAAVLFAVGVLLGVLVWRPNSERAFATRTDSLLRRTEGDFREIARSVVDDVIAYSAVSSRVAGQRRALSIADLPLNLYTDQEGRLNDRLLRESLVQLLADPSASLPEKNAVVRDELLARTDEDLEQRLLGLREEQSAKASQHGRSAASQTVMAWGGLLLVLLALGAFALDKVVVAPVKATTEAVVRFGTGERGVRLDAGGGKEIAALARAFNETAAAVEEAEACPLLMARPCIGRTS